MDLDPFPWLDALIILALIALNGVFAMSELAIVSSRPARLQAMAEGGSSGAAAALHLSKDPGRFLSTVQIGITLIGIIAGAYSGASLGAPTGERIAQLGLVSDKWAMNIGFGLVIGATTFASLVIGELVPKQFALVAPERIAAIVARPMEWLARIAAPFVWLLDKSSSLIFKLLGLNRDNRDALTTEELKVVFTEATHAGIIEEHEHKVISGVVRLADRPVREVMTPRTEVDTIAADASAETIRDRLLNSPHTRLPVMGESVDDIIGVVQARDIVAAQIEGRPLDLRAMMRKAEIVPDQLDAMDALEILRKSEVPMLLVHDEYGHFEGIVTPNDLLAAIAGEFASDQEQGSAANIVTLDDGSLLIDGGMAADAMAQALDIQLPEDRDYATAAGHVLQILRHLPEEGESFVDNGWHFEVVDMDGRKIDKLRVRKAAEKE
ncbi:MAG TPA: hemolysin family protein [Sphingorhabdus sp.]|jgi:putative hemolysin|uniref:hemolysin family protein n=2 Tax=Sphingorhabdus TaxID=1434046 RepID=UPI002C9969EA|nr:hemolysin family protein [Sphingorhabdus sp.]HMT40242.1 hemolysin family protein [Sphingorhabdus sp.]HMU20866.1 hemolysin family protein [Sphingorhabdus sp.]